MDLYRNCKQALTPFALRQRAIDAIIGVVARGLIPMIQIPNLKAANILNDIHDPGETWHAIHTTRYPTTPGTIQEQGVQDDPAV